MLLTESYRDPLTSATCKKPKAATLAVFQKQIDAFREYFAEAKPDGPVLTQNFKGLKELFPKASTEALMAVQAGLVHEHVINTYHMLLQ